MAERTIDTPETPSASTPSPTAENGLSPEARFGFICALLAYTIWGGFPIYIKLLETVDPLEVVSQRIAWSVPFGALIISLRKQWRETIAAAMSAKTLLLLGASATVISVNWFFYVWAVANERVLEASLGYYINPLMFVAAGVLVLGETLTRAQWVGIGLATAGVFVLTVGAGVFPWVAFILALAFTAYGYIRKQTPVGATPGLFIETTLLAPVAIGLLIWLSGHGGLTFGAEGTRMDVLLALSGPMTVLPLTLFALGARRLKLSTIGFIQYIGPTGQFILGLYYGEPFTLAHGICFGLIWIGLAITSIDALRDRPKTVNAGPSTPPPALKTDRVASESPKSS
ncbi:MAG: EamA family transporter RarD [Pseudomonadota bacterium]